MTCMINPALVVFLLLVFSVATLGEWVLLRHILAALREEDING